MTGNPLRDEVLETLAPERLARLDQGALMELVATVWSDVELSAALHGSAEFFWERLLHFARRGYLTAQEDQGTRRLLALTYRAHLNAAGEPLG